MLIAALVGVSALVLLFFGAPYVPTRSADLDILFANLGPGNGKSFVDCGAGDGRVLKAAQQHGYTPIGYELNPFIWLWAKSRLRGSGIVLLCRPWQTADLSASDIAYFFSTGKHITALKKRPLPEILISYGFKPPLDAARLSQVGPYWVAQI